MFVVGLFKYCERVRVLYLATDNYFRDSIQDITTTESKTMKECKHKELEGYLVTAHQVLDVDQHIPNVENELLMAYGFLDMVKHLFADLLLDILDGHTSRSIFDKISADKAFKIIEIELGIIYDLRFTKAKVVYSRRGISLRIVGIILTFLVLMMVSLSEIKLVSEKLHQQHHHHRRHSNIDFIITLILLSVALLVELWAFGQLLVSDQTAYWLIKHEKTIISRAIKCILQISESSIKTKRRWSYSMNQYSLLKFFKRLNEKPLPCRQILKMLGVDKAIEIQLCKSNPISVVEILRERVFNAIKESVKKLVEKHSYDTNLKALYGRRGCRTLEEKQYPDLKWSIVDLEFDQSILVWHLATEILYQNHRDFKDYDDLDKELEKGKWLSQYMLYLLVEHPYMLPLGMGHMKFQDIYYELGDIIEGELKAKKGNFKLFELLINYKNTTLGGRSNLLLLNASKLATQLRVIDERGRWRIIVDIWIEMLGHAASQCRGRYHAQQLRRGGEFLTHVWLLMAHFGLNDLFQARRGDIIADVIRK